MDFLEVCNCSVNSHVSLLVGRLIGRLVSWSVRHYFLKRQDICTCFLILNGISLDIYVWTFKKRKFYLERISITGLFRAHNLQHSLPNFITPYVFGTRGYRILGVVGSLEFSAPNPKLVNRWGANFSLLFFFIQ